MADKRFYAVLEPEDKPLELVVFNTLEGMADHLKTLPSTTRGYLFAGERIYTTRAPHRFLVHGDVRIPLFGEVEELEPDDTDGLGHVEADEVDPVYAKLLKETLPDESHLGGEDEDELDDEDLDEA